MKENLLNTDLYKFIMSEQNIFNSIFCLESYVFDKGLLDTTSPIKDLAGETLFQSDLELYYALSDKHNVFLIDKVIDLCKYRLEELFNNKDNLFTIDVYFKIKGIDEDSGSLKFRPLHTARLIDLICMVCLLNPLMFEDDENAGRKLSDLSKLIPHNFFGNIPSTSIQFLFCKWQNKYKEYTSTVIEHCRKYQKNHQYLTEVCLDIKNFFPSVNPKYIYDFVVMRLKTKYVDDELEILKYVLAKLLYFNIKGNIEPWLKHYYGTEKIERINGVYMNCGIAQGLPQSYFFGNLCMLKVKELMMKEGLFEGDAYFYVDDSVIYLNSSLGESEFEDRIKKLNKELAAQCVPSKENDIKEFVSNECSAFHEQLPYKIAFHERGKSTFCNIDAADNHLDGFEILGRNTSDALNLAMNLDDIDDNISLEKLKAIDVVISRTIKELESNDKSAKVSSQMKMLKRFKKFFLYRNRLLAIRTNEINLDSVRKQFEDHFIANRSIDEWIELYEEDIFQSEYRLIIQMSDLSTASDIAKIVTDFERKIVSNEKSLQGEDGINNNLYFTKDANNAVLMKRRAYQHYNALIQWAESNYKGLKAKEEGVEVSLFKEFIKKIYDETSVFEERGYTQFVFRFSSEFRRRILNTYFSTIACVQPSDSLSFSKENSRKLHYSEFRVLAYLRNCRFENNAFLNFIAKFDRPDISDSLGIDMGLLEVLSDFINYIKNPEWVDNLILTHRITKGLWNNGSKFLNTYTLHNEEHAVTLINQSLHLVKTIDYFTIKPVDYYILFLSCYLHDISMVIHPDMYSLLPQDFDGQALVSSMMLEMHEKSAEFFNIDRKDTIKESSVYLVNVFNKIYEFYEGKVRSRHAKDSALFIKEKSESLLNYLTPTLLSYVEKVSESHGYDTKDVYGLKSRSKDEQISMKYLMILIRLADSMDASKDRVNYHLLRNNIKYMSSASRFHWISHLVTDKFELNAKYEADESKKLNEKPITEHLEFNLYLNVSYLSAIENKVGCENRSCSFNNDCGVIKVEMRKSKLGCPVPQCTFLCRWMQKKHEWLIPELVALNDYLFSVNNSMIKSDISLNIYYKNEETLDQDLFDDVREYLNL